MFWFSRKRKTHPTRRSVLRFESLERRELLTVNILTNDPVAGALTITGDNADNAITIAPSNSAATANTFTVTANTAANGKTTQLQLNGIPVTSPYVVGMSGNLVTGDIAINLGLGQNSLLFGFTTAPTPAADPVAGNVTITDNANDTNTIENVDLMQGLTFLNMGPNNTVVNTISNVQVGLSTTIFNGGNTTTNISNSQLLGPGGLTVVATQPSVVNSSLTVNTCTVIGPVVVLNSSGNSSTTIEGGWLENTLGVFNGDGVNNVQIGTSTAATKIGAIPAVATPVVTIFNGDGGSFTQFLGESAASPLTVLGGISVTNGAAPAGTSNIVSFNSTNAAGAVTVSNGGTPAAPSMMNGVSIQDSNLGLLAVSAAAPNPVTVDNGTGYDTFKMQSINSTCTAPWGVTVDDVIAGLTPATVWGSNDTITGCQLGTGVFGPNDGTPGDGFDLTGDNGSDVVNVASSTINGNTNLVLNGGSNSATFQQKTQLAALSVTTGAAPGLTGNDSVTINTCNITNGLALTMGGLTNAVTITAGTTAGWGSLPNTNFYPILITSTNLPVSQNTLTITTGLYTLIPLGDITGFAPPTLD